MVVVLGDCSLARYQLCSALLCRDCVRLGFDECRVRLGLATAPRAAMSQRVQFNSQSIGCLPTHTGVSVLELLNRLRITQQGNKNWQKLQCTAIVIERKSACVCLCVCVQLSPGH